MPAKSHPQMHRRTNHARQQVSAAPPPREGPRRPLTEPAEGHFNPDELTRRLYMVLADQKADAERRERARRERSKRGLSSSTRPRDGGANLTRERRRSAAEPSTDLITPLKRTESDSCKPPLAASDPDTATTTHYHHVPREAAKQFTRTTTVDNMRQNSDLVHRLSKRALKFHMKGLGQARPGGGETVHIAPAELSRALSQSQARRDKVLDRNQFQRSRILEEAAWQDHEQQSPRKHTFQDELKRLSWHHYPRRNSTGNTTTTDLDNSSTCHNRRSLATMHMDPFKMHPLPEDTTATTTTPHPDEISRFPPAAAAAAAAEHSRVDWTQSDESRYRQQHHHHQEHHHQHQQHHHRLLLLSPLLRKADSLWTLRGARRGSKEESCPSSSGADAEKEPAEAENGDGSGSGRSEESPKARKGTLSFFAKFRR